MHMTLSYFPQFMPSQHVPTVCVHKNVHGQTARLLHPAFTTKAREESDRRSTSTAVDRLNRNFIVHPLAPSSSGHASIDLLEKISRPQHATNAATARSTPDHVPPSTSSL